MFLAIAFPALAEDEKTIIEFVEKKETTAAIGDIIRIRESIPSGQGMISAKVTGSGKLRSSARVRQMAGNQPVIGSDIREFDVEANAKGKITIIVTIKNTVQNRTETKTYTVEIR